MFRTWLLGIISIGLFAISFNREWIAAWLSIPDQLGRPLELIINFLIFAFTGQFVVRILSWIWRRRKNLARNSQDTVILGLQNIYYLTLAGALLMTVLGFWGIDYQTLFTTLSIVAAAIAIISKDFVSEIISGIIISFSSEISIDDYVKIAGHKGKIIDLTLTKIALLNEDDEVIYIPNNKVYSGEVINYTKRAIRRVSIEFEVNVKSLKTIEVLEKDLIEAVSNYSEYIEPDSYNLKTVELHKDAISFKFQYTLRRRERELERDIRKKTIRRVVDYVNNNLNQEEATEETVHPII